jgi:hypothetical protein
MSGGVDSSVTAKLLSEKVRQVKNRSHTFAYGHPRTMIFPPSLCGIGIPGTNLVLMWAVSGRRTGRMFNACAENSTSLAEWCVSLTTMTHSLLTPRRIFRSICQESIGSEYSNLQSRYGRRAIHLTPMSAAMRMHRLVPHRCATHTLFSSEIKFGALLDNLPERTDFLATGQSLI